MLRGAETAPGMGQGRPALANLGAAEREALRAQGVIVEAPSGSMVIRQGDEDDDAFFVLEGRPVAGYTTADGEERCLSTMYPGEFFGEIGVLRKTPRTANVVAEFDSTLYRIPGSEMQQLMAQPAISRLITTKLDERLTRRDLGDLPKMAGYDQDALRELRTTAPELLAMDME